MAISTCPGCYDDFNSLGIMRHRFSNPCFRAAVRKGVMDQERVDWWLGESITRYKDLDVRKLRKYWEKHG